MNLLSEEHRAVYSKSLTLITKTRDQLEHIDQLQFPTSGSKLARSQLLDLLSKVSEQAILRSVDPDVLYQGMLDLQELVELVKRSSVSQISWPFVQFCDKIWKELFPSGSPAIFYSVTKEHNYCIFEFTKRLTEILEGILPAYTLTDSFLATPVYCLELASIEDYNLPLYANIGHEFGHAVFNSERLRCTTDLNATVLPWLALVVPDLVNRDRNQAARRLMRLVPVISCLAEELFCDMIGTYLMGPSFFLSFYEITWSENKRLSAVILSDDDQEIVAYPSHHFRLKLIKETLELDSFCSKAESDFQELRPSKLADCLTCFTSIPCDDSTDIVKVRPLNDEDSTVLEEIFRLHLADLKLSLRSFIKESSKWFRQKNSKVILNLKPDELVDLLRRFDHNVIPNIIRFRPDHGLLGIPADLGTILNAAALFRLHLLVEKSEMEIEDTNRETSIAERLTSKALEVAYIQTEYNNK